MGIMEKKYYEVVDPFFHFRIVGRAESNTYIGRSMALTKVHESRNAKPGSQIHALFGSLFLVEDGEARQVSFRIRKPILEKEYFRFPDTHYLDTMVKNGSLKAINAPEDKIDYRAPKADKEYPRLTSGVLTVEHSSEFEMLKRGFPNVLEVVAANDGWESFIWDMEVERTVGLIVSDGSRRLLTLSFDTVDRKAVMNFNQDFSEVTGCVRHVAASVKDAVAECTGDRLIFDGRILTSLSVLQTVLAENLEEYADRCAGLQSGPAV